MTLESIGHNDGDAAVSLPSLTNNRPGSRTRRPRVSYTTPWDTNASRSRRSSRSRVVSWKWWKFPGGALRVYEVACVQATRSSVIRSMG